MRNNHYGGSRKPARTGRSQANSNKGFPALFKLLALAASLMLLAFYLGNRKPVADAVELAQAPATDQGDPVDPAPITLKSAHKNQATPVNVGDAQFSISGDGRTLTINGDIGRNFFDDLNKAVAANRFLQRIIITSGGGYAGPGLEAAQLIRRKNLTVRVKSYCASMCVGLWAAAAAREMEPDAVIGLHQWRATCDSLPPEQRRECTYRSQFWAAHDISYDGWLRSAGFSERLMKLQETTAASDVALLVAPQLWAEGVDFRVVDSEGKYMSQAATQELLKTRYARQKRG